MRPRGHMCGSPCTGLLEHPAHSSPTQPFTPAQCSQLDLITRGRSPARGRRSRATEHRPMGVVASRMSRGPLGCGLRLKWARMGAASLEPTDPILGGLRILTRTGISRSLGRHSGQDQQGEGVWFSGYNPAALNASPDFQPQQWPRWHLIGCSVPQVGACPALSSEGPTMVV